MGYLAIREMRPGRAARILGAMESMRERLRYPLPAIEQGPYEREISRIREALGDDRFAVERAAGRAMRVEQAIAYARGEEAGGTD